MAAISVAASAKAEVESSYIMALKKPRNEEDSRVRIVEACKNASFAERAIYKKPIGGGFIEGPSIRFAEEVLRHWGNVKILQTTIFDDDIRRIVKITVIDLESNISFSKEITIEKHVERKSAKCRTVVNERVNSYGERVFIVQATEDELMIKEAALASKTIRNGGLRLIPSHVIEQALENARKAVKGQIEKDPAAERRKLFDAFADKGVKPSDLQDYIGHSPEQLTPAELMDLRAVFTSLKDGESTWQEIVEAKTGAKKEPAKGDLSNLKPGDPATHTKPGDKISEPAKEKKDLL